MCEPSLSIVQYKGQHGQVNRLTMFLGQQKDAQMIQEYKGFVHLAKMGKGHSEAIDACGVRETFIAPTSPAQYEGHWWNRSFEIDQYPSTNDFWWNHREEFLLSDDYTAAEYYANQVCLADLGKFRCFFETSIRKTDRSHMYFERFPHMLNRDGRNRFSMNRMSRASDEHKMKYCLGFTRKPALLVPEWQ